MRVDQIVVGERLREDYGDIAGLADSLRTFGMLQAIVVDDAGNLVAGARRLRAADMLGWTEIPTRALGSLSAAERRDIELEENLRRKDLTAWEYSEALKKRAQIGREIDRAEFRTESVRNSAGGRPEQPGSYRRVADRIGVPVATIRDAERHVAAVERYPDLKPMEQGEALQFARALDAAPEDVREAIRPDIRVIAETRKQAPSAVRDVLERIEQSGGVQRAKLKLRYVSAVAEARSHLLGIDPDDVAGLLDETRVLITRHFIGDCRSWLDRMEKALGRGLRLVGED